MQWKGWLVLAAVVLAGACTSGGGSSGSPSASSTSPSASSPAGASAAVRMDGDAALTAAFTQPDVRCSFPDVAGPSIALLSSGSSDLVFRVKVQEGKVTVLVNDSASHQRDFSGSGVATFDPATGAQIDSMLTEVPSGAEPGDIGQLTAIKASVDCAGQDPGTSTVTLTGDTPNGPLTNAPLETARIECNPEGSEVNVVGVVTINGAKEFIDLGLRPDGITVNKMTDNSRNNYIAGPGTATVTYTGASASGDAAGQGAAAPHVLHVEGDATCGTPVN